MGQQMTIEDHMEAAYQVAKLRNPLIAVVSKGLGEEAAKVLYCMGWSDGQLQGLRQAKAIVDGHDDIGGG